MQFSANLTLTIFIPLLKCHLNAESDHKKLDELKKSEDGKKEVYEVGADYTVDLDLA